MTIQDLVFRDTRLPEEPSPDDLRAAAGDYEAICLANIRAVVERFERHDGAYPFVDTKLDLRTGRDHPAGDLVRGFGRRSTAGSRAAGWRRWPATRSGRRPTPARGFRNWLRGCAP